MKRIVGWQDVYVLVVLMALVLAGCTGGDHSAQSTEQVYVTVNGAPLTESELRSIVPSEFYDTLTPEHKREIVKDWVNRQLLYQEALSEQIDSEPDIARILESSRRDLLSIELLERKLAGIETPTDAELEQYYNEHRDNFILDGDEFQVRYALFDNINDAQRFWTRVKQGASFSELAEADSRDPSAFDGGNLGFISESTVEPALWEATVNTYETLGTGKISSAFSVIEGWGIVIVDSVIKRGSVKPFADVRDQVFDYYMVEQRDRVKNELLAQLTEEAEITYHF